MRPRSLNSITPVTLAKRVSSFPQPTFKPGLIFVPRCHTMMEPPGTSWPPKTFTPSRCAFESRPFLELPKPFLCAISHLHSKIADLQFGEGLAVPDGFLVLLLALEFEDEDLVAASVRGDGRGNGTGSDEIATFGKRGFDWQFDLGADIAGELF